jgi:spore coat polysaccharide biosynthesis protein SpsF
VKKKLKIGFIIICRYNSKRLPGKILKEINGKPIIAYIIERLMTSVEREHIIVATSREHTDDPIENFCNQNNIHCFRGSLDNVAERFLQCAQKYSFDFATRINGDNFFMDVDSLKEMIDITLSNKYDFVTNLKNRTFPKGMSIEIVRISFYEKMYRQFNNNDHFEHVTQYLYQHDDQSRYYHYLNTVCPEAGGIQLAIDDEGDFRLAEKIIHTFTGQHTNYGLKDIYKRYKMLKDNEQ